jgi:hypothetical protein
MISTYTKGFSWKKWPKFARFQMKKFPNCQILMIRSSRKPRIPERFWFFATLKSDDIAKFG